MSIDLPESVRAALRYDPATGEFYWLIDRANVKAGDLAGNIGPNGYRTICVDYEVYLAHRLALAFRDGVFPAAGTHVDHIDGRTCDNRLENLRVVTPSRNALNRKGGNRNNTSGALGVCEVKPGRFVAFLTVNRRRRHLGTFDTVEQAKRARDAAHSAVAP